MTPRSTEGYHWISYERVTEITLIYVAAVETEMSYFGGSARTP